MNGLFKIGLRTTLLGATMLCVAGPASASFLNDTINWEVEGTISTTFPESGTLTPAPTDTDTVILGGGGEFYSIFADGDTSRFVFLLDNGNNTFDHPYGDVTLELSDIDWLPATGVNLTVTETDGSGGLVTTDHQFTTTLDSVTLTYQNVVTVRTSSFIEFEINADQAPAVPEPGSFAGLLTGLAALGVLRRRRRRRN